MVRFKKQYTEHFGGLTGQGSSKAEAKADLQAQLLWLADNNHTHVEQRFGAVIVISATSHGWETMVMWPDEIARPKSFVKVGGSGHVGRQPFANVLMAARLNVAQSTWNVDAVDDDLVSAADLDERAAGDLRSWIAWQRRYQAHIAAGNTPAKAHELASGLNLPAV